MESKSSPVGERNSQLEKALLSRARDSVGERSFFEAGEERTKLETKLETVGADERSPAKEMRKGCCERDAKEKSRRRDVPLRVPSPRPTELRPSRLRSVQTRRARVKLA